MKEETGAQRGWETHSHASTHTHTHWAHNPIPGDQLAAPLTKLAQFLIVRGGNAASAMDIAGPILHHPPGALQSEGPAFDSVALRLHLPAWPSQPSFCRPNLSVPSFPYSL